MTVTLTITDPTADESRAVRAYLDALHGGAATAPGANPSPLGVWTPTARSEEPPAGLGTGVTETSPSPITPIDNDEPVSAATAGAPDFDSAGYPWDERIHASSRATVADGTWRKKRGVSDELVAEVEAELAAAKHNANLAATDAELIEQARPLDVPAPEVPEAPVGEPASAPVADAPSPSPDSVDGAGGSDAPPPPPAAAPNPFLAVMSRIGKSKLDKAKKDELLTAAGALDEKGNPSILVLNKRPELIDGFVALLDSEGV